MLRLLRYDRRGHGASRPQNGAATIDELGADLLSLLDELALEQVSFCGLSLGGVEGMWLAANAPGRIDRLACCCTAPVFEPKEQWLERAGIVRASGIAAIADGVLARWFRRRSRPRIPRSSIGSGRSSSPSIPGVVCGLL